MDTQELQDIDQGSESETAEEGNDNEGNVSGVTDVSENSLNSEDTRDKKNEEENISKTDNKTSGENDENKETVVAFIGDEKQMQNKLETKALEELTMEAKRASMREAELGDMAWSKPRFRTNKRFLLNTLVSTLRHPIKKAGDESNKRKNWKTCNESNDNNNVYNEYDENMPFRGRYMRMNHFRGYNFRGRFENGNYRGRGRRGDLEYCFTPTGSYNEEFQFDDEFNAANYRPSDPDRVKPGENDDADAKDVDEKPPDEENKVIITHPVCLEPQEYVSRNFRSVEPLARDVESKDVDVNPSGEQNEIRIRHPRTLSGRGQRYFRRPMWRPYWHPGFCVEKPPMYPDLDKCDGDVLFRNGNYFVPHSTSEDESDDDKNDHKRNKEFANYPAPGQGYIDDMFQWWGWPCPSELSTQKKRKSSKHKYKRNKRKKKKVPTATLR